MSRKASPILHLLGCVAAGACLTLLEAPTGAVGRAPEKAAAGGYGARVISAGVSAKVERDGNRLPKVGEGTVLRGGDRVRTGAENLEWDLGKRARVRLKPNTELHLKKLDEPVPPANLREFTETSIHLKSGTALFKVRRLRGQHRFLIDTPSANLAARGTAFSVIAEEKNTSIVVEHGVVYVAAKERPDDEMPVHAGEMVSFANRLPEVADKVRGSRLALFEELQALELPEMEGEELPDLPLGSIPGEIRRGKYPDLSCVALAPDEVRAAVGSGKKVVVFNALSGALIRELDGHQSPVSAVAFTPRGEALLSADRGGLVVRWDLETGRGTPLFRHTPGIPLRIILPLPDGRSVFTEGTFISYSVSGVWVEGRRVGAVSGEHVVFSSRRSRFFTVRSSREGSRIYEQHFPTGRVVGQLPPPPPPLQARDPKDQAFLDRERDRMDREILARWGIQGPLALLDSRSLLLSASKRGAILLWDSRDGRPRGQLGPVPGTIDSLAVSGNAARILAGSSNGDVHVFDVASGLRRTLRKDYWNGAPFFAVTADGRRALIGHARGLLHYWQIYAEPQVPEAAPPVPPE